MKKILSLIMISVIVFSFCGCSKEKTSSDAEVDIEYYAKLGRIPESEYSLGSNVQTVKDELSAKFEENPESYYNITEGEKTALIDTGEFSYYYLKEKEDEGISYIVDFNAAYGFELGTVSVEVKSALNGYECTEKNADDNSVFFMNYSENCTYLEYNIGSNVLMFVFENNALCATVIYNPELWIL